MNLLESARMALTALSANKARSALTMLGVVIGVAAVIALISAGRGAQSQVLSSLEKMGTNLVFAMRALDVPTAEPLTLADAEAIGGLPGVTDVIPQMGGLMNVTYKGDSSPSNVFGTIPEYGRVHNADVAVGRFLTQADEDGAARVAVVGLQTADDLGTRDLLGEHVYIGGVPFTVVGLLEPRGSTGFLNRDQMVLIPLSTALARVTGSDSLYYVSAQVGARDLIPSVQRDMTKLLRERHRIAPDSQDDFLVMKQTDLVDMMGTVTTVFTALAGGIAAISLLVGGIGIMNIMLVSVTERTREIGIRKAIGARGQDILAQFLVESVVLSILGGVIGIAVGAALTRVAQMSLKFSIPVTPSAVLLAFAVSVAIGIFFGVYPAWRASRQDPIEALRYE